MSSDQKPVIVLLLRATILGAKETAQLQEKYPGKKLEFRTSQPADFAEHLVDCHDAKADVVVLPREMPIPAAAMKEGFVHVAFTPNGIEELVSINPVFKPFNPKS